MHHLSALSRGLAFARHRQRSVAPALLLARNLAVPRSAAPLEGGSSQARYGGRGREASNRARSGRVGEREASRNHARPEQLSGGPRMRLGGYLDKGKRAEGVDTPGRPARKANAGERDSSQPRDRSPRSSVDRPSIGRPSGGDDARSAFQPKTARPPFFPGADPHLTAMKLTRYLARVEQPYTAADLEAAERVVKSAPKAAVNVAVWNILLKAYGRARMYTRMFKVYNDMKKTGIIPSSRTYTTMLSNFSKTLGLGSEKTMARATLLYDQAQRQLRTLMREAPVEGLVGVSSTPSAPAKDNAASRALADQITVAPTNAYLQCLAHFGNTAEIQRVVGAMPLEGPLAPDKYTYAVAFNALLDGGRSATAGRTAVQIWERALQQRKAQRGSGLEDRVLDTAVATLALRCFMAGDDEAKRTGLALLDPLFGLSAPGKSASLSGAVNPDLPRLPLTDRAAETCIKLCLAADKPALAAHVAEQVLQRADLVPVMTQQGANGIIEAFAAAGDVPRCIEILQHGIGRRHETWNEESYCEAIKGVVRKGDYDLADEVYKLAQRQGDTIAQAPQLLGLLIRTAIASGRVAAMRQAWKHFYKATQGRLPSVDASLEGQAAKRAVFWRGKLRQDIDELTQRLLSARQGDKTGVSDKEERDIRGVRERIAQEAWGMQGAQRAHQARQEDEEETPRRFATGRR